MRGLVYSRDLGICQVCRKFVGLAGELDHIIGGNTDARCWCAENLQWICSTCHRNKHLHVKWSKKK
jgi:5-methylcytosine-specific restriction endonuclease McrA